MKNILVLLAFIGVSASADVKTHVLTVQERLDRIEHINVTAEKKIKKGRHMDKEVMEALEEVRKIRRAGASKEEVMEALKDVRKLRHAKGEHKRRAHSHPHSHKGRPHRHGRR